MDAAAQTRAFATSVERRTIGVTLLLAGDWDGKDWWLTTDLEARTATGGERLFKSSVRVHATPGEWIGLAELSREDYLAVLKALPGGLWKSNAKTKSDERYYLRCLADKST